LDEVGTGRGSDRVTLGLSTHIDPVATAPGTDLIQVSTPNQNFYSKKTCAQIKAPGMADMPGEITGGTECYGRRYSCGDPLTSPTKMSSRLLLVAFHN